MHVVPRLQVIRENRVEFGQARVSALVSMADPLTPATLKSTWRERVSRRRTPAAP